MAPIAFILLFLSNLLQQISLPITPRALSPRDSIVIAVSEVAQSDWENRRTTQRSALVNRFKDNSANLSEIELVDIYDQAFRKEMIREQRNYEIILWILLGFLLTVIGILLRRKLSKLVKKLLEFFTSVALKYFGGNPITRFLGLRRYRRALYDSMMGVPLGLNPDRPLLKDKSFDAPFLRSRRDETRVRALQVIRDHRRIIILGPPGSGKSTTLMFFTLAFIARLEDWIPHKCVPILFDLSRVNSSNVGLRQALELECARMKFINAASFLEYGMERGRIVFLLDGLDELSTTRQTQTVQEIRDLITSYRNCRFILTARRLSQTAGLDELVEDIFDVQGLMPDQIAKYMKARSEDFPEERPIDTLIQEMQRSPHLKILMENPLTLNVIMRICTNTSSVMGPNRAELYAACVDHLLHQWKAGMNKFLHPTKRIMLEKLALMMMQNQPGGPEQEVPVPLEDVIHCFQQHLPGAGLGSENAIEVLKEIVDKSFLLVPLDSGRAYQFRNVLFKHFFAAAALKDQSIAIIQAYVVGGETWEETLVFWIGLSTHVEKVLLAIHENHLAAAVMCMCEARYVNKKLSDAIISGASTYLKMSEPSKAFFDSVGRLAALSNSWGRQMFSDIRRLLETAGEADARHKAAQALAASKSSEAAELLSKYYGDLVIRRLLRGMGNAAVPTLIRLASSGRTEAVEDLCSIDTPEVTTALIRMLWNSNLAIAVGSAFHLAESMLAERPSGAIDRQEIPEVQDEISEFGWIWTPFMKKDQPESLGIVSRICWLLAHGPTDRLPPQIQRIDARIAVPLLAIALRKEGNLDVLQHCSDSQKRELFKDIEGYLSKTTFVNPFHISAMRRGAFKYSIPEMRIFLSEMVRDSTTLEFLRHFTKEDALPFKLQFAQRLLHITNPSVRWRSILKRLTPELQFDLLWRIMNNPPLEKEDWTDLFEPSKRSLKTKRYFATVLIGTSILSAVAVNQFFSSALSLGGSFLGQLPYVILLFGSFIKYWRGKWLDKPNARDYSFLFLLGPIYLPFFVRGCTRCRTRPLPADAILLSLWTVTIVHLTWQTGTTTSEMVLPGIGLFLSFLILSLLWHIGTKRARMIRNPLLGIPIHMS